jgi:Family of unknown function (DUF6152)
MEITAMHRFLLRAAVFGLFLGTGGAVFAHHGGATLEQTKTVTFKGTVQAFEWQNPHVMLMVLAEPDGQNPPQLWRLELSSPGVLTRLGHSKRSFNIGDKVTVECHPQRDGSPTGRPTKVTLSTGKVLTFSFQDLERPGLQ